MKIIAMYLPQYYRTKENDSWWGEGFTDWVSTKKANSLFENHIQPNVPLDNNYYDLLDKETMIWQANLMKKYGIDGVCIYHYWFSKGKQILEKPVDNLLKWNDIDMPFCLCWANETWARSWSNVKNANMWSVVEEPQSREKNEILLEQEYGGADEWEEHIQYLIRCFKDRRYIRIDDKPVFVIYKPALIIELKKMINAWKSALEKAGIEGIYIIGANCPPMYENVLDGVLFHEPSTSLSFSPQKKDKSGLTRADYEDVWNNIIQNHNIKGIKTYYGGFVKYDDTPRRGTKGVVIENASPDLFKKYLVQLIHKNEVCENEITFINAWNEWGEGMYLEPDKHDFYGYLEAVLEARNDENSNIELFYDSDKYISYIKKQNYMHEVNMNVLDMWMTLRNHGLSLIYWFNENGYNSLAIYGYGILAKHLIAEMNDSSIEIRYVIDQNQNIQTEYPAFLPDDELPKVDVIVVCVPFYYWMVSERLIVQGNKNNVISIQTIIEESEKMFRKGRNRNE